MYITGYEQKNGVWVPFTRKVGLKEYLIHLWYSFEIIGGHFYKTIELWYEDNL